VSNFATVIEAAGGLVWRATAGQGVEVLLVHRPEHEDWSLPKGKRRRREAAVRCALREVREETGLRCTVGDELPTARYKDRKGRSKQVRFWSMTRGSGTFRPNREVDAVRWVPIEELAELLTDDEMAVVAGFRRLLSAAA
jgi:8-oxo-dGTP pyrophosphatase MutT (NUDIX family)